MSADPPESGEQAQGPANGAGEWLGRARLDDQDGRRVGRVDATLVDARDGAPTWVVVRTGLRGRRHAVPFDFVAGAAGRAWVACGRTEIQRSPEVDPARGLTVAAELELCEHYGIPTGVRRRAALAGRDGEAGGSVAA